MIKHIAFSCCVYALSLFAFASEYELPINGSRLIGENVIHQVKQGEYFQQLAEDYDVGFLALMAANPKADPFLLKTGQQVIIPKQMILPYAKQEGIVINVSELRLYYFSPDKSSVRVFPIGIGRQGLSTPKVISFISDKRENPEWRPTKDMKRRHFESTGKQLPDVMPAGPNNPFGKYALRIGHSAYLIHGSNKRFGIGMRASSGCIRLFDQDIEWLYNNVAVNTQVRIVEQPIKMTYASPTLRLIEVHQPLSNDSDEDQSQTQAKAPILNDAVQAFIGTKESHIKQVNDLISSPNGLVSKLIFNEL